MQSGFGLRHRGQSAAVTTASPTSETFVISWLYASSTPALNREDCPAHSSGHPPRAKITEITIKERRFFQNINAQQ